MSKSLGRSRSAMKRRYSKPGSAPGILTAPPGVEGEARVKLIAYGPEHVEERQVENLDEAFRAAEGHAVTWIDVEGLGDIGLIERLGSHFGFHRLALEDVLHCGQRPKAEHYDQHLFLILRSLHLERRELVGEQVSLFLGRGFVVTFQQIPGDSWEGVRNRIRQGRGVIRQRGADYLAYALIDALIDEFFPVLEHYGEEVERLEDTLVEKATTGLLGEIHQIKRDLLTLRRAAWPERDLLNSLLRDGSELI